MSGPVSAELALAMACCRWPRSEGGDAAVRATAGEAIDWERFAGIIARNRISALAKDALDRAGVEPPAAVASRLAQGQRNAAFTSLALARESIRLQRAFDAAGLPALIVKGAPMAMLAYGDLGQKESWDIDLLTDSNSVMAARALLVRLGYAMTKPADLNDAQFARFVPHDMEACFRHRETGISTELHWKLVGNALLLAGVGPQSETQTVSLGAGSVRTLADGPLFAYLCVHGASHNWARLKWLADVAAFLSNRSPDEIEDLYRAASAVGAARPALLAILLSRDWLGLRISDCLDREIRNHSLVRALAQNVAAGLDYGGGTAEHEGYTRPWWRARIASLFFGRGAAPVARELRVLWTSSFDRAHVALPRRLVFLYHFLRIPLWLLRAGTRFARRLRFRLRPQ